jgi:hypothetical protein
MNKFLFSFFISFIWVGISKAQVTVDFEGFNLGALGYNNGSDLSGGFQTNELLLRNNYSVQFASWEGFAISSTTDTVTTEYSNQYSSFAGGASNGSKYAVSYSYSPSFLVNTNRAQLKKLSTFKYSNTTIGARVMKTGDGFSKKFGGATGNEPDYFKLLVFNYFNGQKTDSAEIFLADFRSQNNSQDYIVKDWRTATFNFSSPFDSIGFQLESTDNTVSGFMNTPAYFCLDEIQYSPFTNVEESSLNVVFRAFPNPFQNQLQIVSTGKIETISIVDQLGRQVNLDKTETDNGLILNTEKLPSGFYHVSLNGRSKMKLIKN